MALTAQNEYGENVIKDVWGAEDIQSVAICDFDMSLSKDQLDEVMDVAVERYDINYGINTSSIRSAIAEVVLSDKY